MRFILLFLIAFEAYGVTYHELYCNRIDREQNERNLIIKRIDKTLERIKVMLKRSNAEEFVNRSKFLRYYKNWDYKNQRLKRKSENYIEYAVTRGCPLL